MEGGELVAGLVMVGGMLGGVIGTMFRTNSC